MLDHPKFKQVVQPLSYQRNGNKLLAGEDVGFSLLSRLDKKCEVDDKCFGWLKLGDSCPILDAFPDGNQKTRAGKESLIT